MNRFFVFFFLRSLFIYLDEINVSIHLYKSWHTDDSRRELVACCVILLCCPCKLKRISSSSCSSLKTSKKHAETWNLRVKRDKRERDDIGEHRRRPSLDGYTCMCGWFLHFHAQSSTYKEANLFFFFFFFFPPFSSSGSARRLFGFVLFCFFKFSWLF